MLITVTTPSIMAKETPDDDESMVAVQMFPPETTAASFVPSLEEVMPLQACELAVEVQEAPESLEV